MKSTYYITFIIGLGLTGLSGCAGVPIAKTNCWARAGSTVTASTMGTSAPSGVVSRAATPVLDVIPCK
jgi:branched-subunit amino acid ABC-type transport system permease component